VTRGAAFLSSPAYSSLIQSLYSQQYGFLCSLVYFSQISMLWGLPVVMKRNSGSISDSIQR
jgi:hypothetical protein